MTAGLRIARRRSNWSFPRSVRRQYVLVSLAGRRLMPLSTNPSAANCRSPWLTPNTRNEGSRSFPRHDIYQMLAYCTALSAVVSRTARLHAYKNCGGIVEGPRRAQDLPMADGSVPGMVVHPHLDSSTI